MLDLNKQENNFKESNLKRTFKNLYLLTREYIMVLEPHNGIQISPADYDCKSIATEFSKNLRGNLGNVNQLLICDFNVRMIFSHIPSALSSRTNTQR